MSSPDGLPVLPCPVCGTPIGPAATACPVCGLPAAGTAALVVARADATLLQFAQDRAALLAALRAAAPGRPAGPGPVPVAAPAPPAPPAGPWPPVAAAPPRPPRRRLSPQQVLLGLGALLLVAGALAFVALGWTRLGLAFQAAVLVTVTAGCAAASAWAARRGLRATEEALAAAGAALLAIDLGAAHARGLLGADQVPLRPWTAVACAVLLGAGVLLGRATRTTATWPLVALVAGQPLPLLVLPPHAVAGPAGVAVLLTLAAADLAAGTALRRALAPVAGGLGGVAAVAGGGLAVVTAATGSLPESWGATGVLLAAGAAGWVSSGRLPGRLSTGLPAAARRRLPPGALPVLGAGTVALALSCSLARSGQAGPVLGGAAGLALLTAAGFLAGRARAGEDESGPGRRPVLMPVLLSGGGVLALAGAAALDADDRPGTLALLVLGAVAPAAVAAVRAPGLRVLASAATLLVPAAAVPVATAGDRLAGPTTGLLLAVTAALAFAAGAARAGAPEEPACAGAGAVSGVAAAWVTGEAGAWGQLGLQLAVVGAAAGAYALAARRRPVAVAAVADLVVAAWTAIGGAGVDAPEAYTLPAAAGLLLVAVPRLRRGGPSWGAEGAAVAVGLAPSALAEVADPGALRLVLVVAAGVLLTGLGAFAHRQAPFVVGAGALAAVALGRLGPYAPLLPRWLSLAVAGLVLLVLGATYERRRQQAREAVAWVSQLS